MNRYILALLAPLSFSACSMISESSEPPIPANQTVTSHVNLVPLPQTINYGDGELLLNNVVTIATPSAATDSAAALRTLLTQSGFYYATNDNAVITLKIAPKPELGEEGYTLHIDNRIEINANTDTGLFYGVQTLSQLMSGMSQSQAVLPRLTITDSPQYHWRGSMLDVARNFMSVDYVKQHIDRMAKFKLNKLHLHLTDDQGWRIEIKSRPKLTEVGAQTSVSGRNAGFYTQQQMREIIAYAVERQIEIIPEVDIPGHTQAAIASYNELACDDVVTNPAQNKCDDVVGDARLAPYSGTCVGFSALCSSKKPDIVFEFVTDVLTELAVLFPSPYLHIGGDEVLNEEKDSFSSFITRADAIVASLGKKLIAWEEASRGNIRSDSLLQFWNDDYDISPALEKGIHLILSPCSYTYLDHANYDGQPDTYTWCAKQGIPLERVYSLTPENYQQVVGVEAPLWSEKVADDATADNRNWPRLAAIAEVSWTNQSQRDYSSFVQRLSHLKPYLDSMNIHYHKAEDLNW